MSWGNFQDNFLLIIFIHNIFFRHWRVYFQSLWKNAECKDRFNSYTCECNEGFTGNGTKCTDNNITDN